MCVNIYVYIHTKEEMIATRVMQSSSKELGTSVSDTIKCKWNDLIHNTLNSQVCIGAAAGFGVIRLTKS